MKAQIVKAMQGNVCRCGTYPRIVAAVRRAVALEEGGSPMNEHTSLDLQEDLDLELEPERYELHAQDDPLDLDLASAAATSCGSSAAACSCFASDR